MVRRPFPLKPTGRRSFLGGDAGALAATFWADETLEGAIQSDLKITGLRVATIGKNFLVLENRAVDVPWWENLVEGIEKPIVKHGFVPAPEKPGLGFTLNDDAMKKHRKFPGYFEPATEWDKKKAWDRLWS